MTTATARMHNGSSIEIEPPLEGRYAWTAKGAGWFETSTADTLCIAFAAATAALAYREREKAA